MGQQQSKPTSSNGSLLSKTISSPSTPLTPISRRSAHTDTPITPLTPKSQISRPIASSPYPQITPYDRISGFIRKPSDTDEITRPAPAREITRLSDILDPRELHELLQETPTRSSKSYPSPAQPKMVHSPSGHQMDVFQYLANPERPLAMWERQEKVRQATREGIARLEAESRGTNRSRIGSRTSVREKIKKSHRQCGYWPF